MISLAGTKVGETLKNMAYQKRSELNFTITHTFIKRCGRLSTIVPTYIIIALVWIAIAIGYWIHTFVVNKANALYLQRALIMLPIIKIFETLITGLYLKEVSLGNFLEDPSEKYIDMARISIITLSYTVMLALMYLMQQGLERDYFSNVKRSSDDSDYDNGKCISSLQCLFSV
jgi:hypothetical protein